MYNLHDIVEMKKQHPCGTNRWEIIRMGADIKIECQGCEHVIMLSRGQFEKRMKKVIQKAEEN
ncbi:DUF951 family protein [Lactobacillus sp. S2-2]|uniref:DUF951 domain-containing protein n=1 Tax=Lactobacillus sp. S2-2 TaxID=2692917 RepID=UPI001F192CAA|nr:DUF951 domain-containing protein [Lactobacillus sp. S2-2]MCF6515208.1 DUF951 family protein [Lactobacillus sp. S2-2]